MKPDAHKRKKNAIYKKKHGIVTAPKSGEKLDLQKDNAKQGAKQNTAGQHSSPGGAVAAGGAAATGGAVDSKLNKLPSKESELRSSDDDDDDEEAAAHSETFSRRKLVSNWERYEEKQPEPGEEPEEPEPEVDLDYMRSFAAKALLELESKRDEFCMYNDTDVPCEQFLSLDTVKQRVEEESGSSTSSERPSLKHASVLEPKFETAIDESDNLSTIALADDRIKSTVIKINSNLLNNEERDELVFNDARQCVSNPEADEQLLNELLSTTILQTKPDPTLPDSSGHYSETSFITSPGNTSDQKENSLPNYGTKNTENVKESVGSMCLTDKEEVSVSNVASVAANNSIPNNEPGLLSVKVSLSKISGFSSNTCKSVPLSVLNEVKLPTYHQNIPVPSLSELEDDLDLLLAM